MNHTSPEKNCPVSEEQEVTELTEAELAEVHGGFNLIKIGYELTEIYNTTKDANEKKRVKYFLDLLKMRNYEILVLNLYNSKYKYLLLD